MRHLHLQLLERLVHNSELNPLAQRIFLAYAMNPQADFESEIKPIVKYNVGIMDPENQDKSQKMEEITERKADILEEYRNRLRKGVPEEKQDIKSWFIKELQIKNFRKFGELPENDFYSLNMEKEDSDLPKSLILIGRNGVGKSSLYGAIEDITTNSVSEALLRKVNKENFTNRDGKVVENKECINLRTNVKEFHSYKDFVSYFKDREMNILLCSENDIFELGRFGQDNGVLLWASITGYKEICELIEHLEAVEREMEIVAAGILRNRDKQVILEQIGLKEEDIEGLTSQALEAVICQAIEDKKVILSERYKNLLLKKVEKKHLSQYIDKVEKPLVKLKEFSFVNFHTSQVTGLKKILREISTLMQQIFSFDRELFQEGAVISEFNDRYDALIIALDAFFNARVEKQSLKKDPLIEVSGKVRDLIQWLSQINDRIYQCFFSEYRAEMQQLIKLEHQLVVDKTKNAISEQVQLVKKYVLALKELLREEVLKLYKRCGPTIEKVMNYFDDASPEYRLESDTDGQKMFFHLHNDKNPDREYIPKIFYNNFRYKLFYMTLKVAAGIAFMEQYGAFPIVLDDVFYASDFYSRKKIIFFFDLLIKLIQEEMKNLVQIICFTHDEVVFSAIREAVMKNGKTDQFIFGRLVKPELLINKKANQDSKRDMNLYINLYGK